jgi:hypothetical protein
MTPRSAVSVLGVRSRKLSLRKLSDGLRNIYWLELRLASDIKLFVPAALQSLAPTNSNWAHVVDLLMCNL